MEQRHNVYADAQALVNKMAGVSQALDSAFDPSLRRLVDLRVSQINDCHFCMNMHTKEALDGGESHERLDALPRWEQSPLFSEKEKAAFAWAEALTRAASSGEIDNIYVQAKNQLDSAEISTLTVIVAMINAWNRIGIAANRH